jgi:hypothetical protein
MSMKSNRTWQRRRADDAPGDLAMFGEMLADYGADRLRQIMRKAFAGLEMRLAVLRRVAARAESAPAGARPGDVEECARLLQFLRIEGFDAGFRGFAEACRAHERRARHGVALAKREVEALTEICRAARDRMERRLSVFEQVPA